MQDITAPVDFTRVARSAGRHGLRVGKWATQAWRLIDEGVLQEVQEFWFDITKQQRVSGQAEKDFVHAR